MAQLTEAYERCAPAFVRAADPLVYRVSAEPLVAAVRAIAGRRPGPVLDVAAGAGAFGRAFPDVVAVDLATGQLGTNTARHRVCADAEQLPFHTDSFTVAGCAFGINHVLDPARALSEMARVAPLVAVSTWSRPEEAYAPKEAVRAALERQAGSGRTEVGELLDHLGEQVGSIDRVSRLLRGAGLDAAVSTVEVEIPWPGLDAYLDYRVGLPSTPEPSDLDVLRDDVAQALAGMPAESLTWRPQLVIGVGTRRPARSGPLEPSGQGTATHEPVA